MNRDRALVVVICAAAILFAAYIKISPKIYFNYGQKLLQKQEYVKAYKSFKKAYNFDKKNKDYKYYYTQTLTKLKPTLKVQKEIFKIASSTESDSAQQLAKDKIGEWRNIVLYNIGDNYIEQAPINNQIIRWEKFPLKVAIEVDNNVPAYYRQSILKAMEQWQISVPFVKFTLENKQADIIIKVLPMPENICDEKECKYVAGFTVPDYKGNHLKKMTITLYSKDPKGNFFSDKEIYNTTVHELGHALGIMGHSYSIGDLMYMGTFYSPVNASFQYLSTKDINTITLLYKLIPDITNNPQLKTKGLVYAPIILGTSEQISERKLKEAQNYIKTAPDISNGYIDLGVAYSELGKQNEAIKAFETAFNLSKTDEEKYIASYNLAVAYMNSKNPKQAMKFAKMAQNYSNTEDVQELIMNINLPKK